MFQLIIGKKVEEAEGIEIEEGDEEEIEIEEMAEVEIGIEEVETGEKGMIEGETREAVEKEDLQVEVVIWCPFLSILEK